MKDNFKYSVIGDNTSENREWLEMLGKMSIDKECLDAHLLTSEMVYYSIPIGSIAFDYDIHIDCRNNPQLFRAVTAMRNDSDYMQWFVRGNSESDIILETDNIDNWVLCEINNFQEFGEYFGVYHKASLEELINHFSLNPDKSNSNL